MNTILPLLRKGSFIRSFVLFACIIVVVVMFWFVWNAFLSPESRATREMEKNYALYENWMQEYNQAITEDTYGGKTPEETLRLFIEALENEDIELASKYFLLDTKNSRKKYELALSEKKEDGTLTSLLDILRKMEKVEDGAIPDNTQIYGIKNSVGLLDYSIIFKKNNNPSAVIWKIEEM